MKTNFFLQSFGSKKSSNTSEGLNVHLKGKRKLLPFNDISEMLSQDDIYNDERKSCNIIRLTCQVNPICSNVLFNDITEIVKDEGGNNVSFINYGLGSSLENVIFKSKTMEFWSGNNMTYLSNVDFALNPDSNPSITTTAVTSTVVHPTNSIRDMQLSNKDNGFIYHCGIDVFNNHLIRSNTFKTVCKIKDGTSDAFNTIADVVRDVNGEYIKEMICFPKDVSVKSKCIGLHLYELDEILTFDAAKSRRLLKKYNGWLGFENKTKIKSYMDFSSKDKGSEMRIERPIMYKNGGDFIDMYPGRDLYSFVPKYNTKRKRLEKNWNYCITYPSSSYTPTATSMPFSDIIECNDGLNSLKTIYFDENIKSDNGLSEIVMYSISKHGLSKGDYVNIYRTYTDGDEVLNEKVLDNAEVLDIVDEYIFTVFSSDIRLSSNWVLLKDSERNGSDPLIADGRTFTFSQDMAAKRYFVESGESDKIKYYIVNDKYVNIDKNAQNISYKKVVSDIECDYYIRIFSKLPNFKFASGDTSSEYEIYKKRDDGETMLSIYQDNKYNFESHTSRLAFAKNIYSDEVGEIVFTDDIDISNIHDNRGRPLTSLYLTIIKNNKGYKEWYGYDYKNKNWEESEINSETVEYSHAFGKLTYGIETSYESSFGDESNGICRITNVKLNNGDKTPSGYTVDGILNDNTDDTQRAYKSSSGKNIVIGKNEIWYDTDKNFYGDLCYYDNYNAIERHISYVMHRFNTAQRESINSASGETYFNKYVYDEIIFDDYDGNEYYTIKTHESAHKSNSKKEGYYYIPHYEIPIKTFDKLDSAMPDFLTIRQIVQVGEETSNIYQFTTLENHFLSIGDKAMIYDMLQDKYYMLVTISGDSDDYRVFTCNVYDEKTNEPTPIVLEENEEKDDLKLFKIDNIDVPSYSSILRDGTCRLIWRNVLNNGFNRSDNNIEVYPFTNGAFYVNKKIDLYVRRQDPYNYYGLYSSSDIDGVVGDVQKEDDFVKNINIEC